MGWRRVASPWRRDRDQRTRPTEQEVSGRTSGRRGLMMSVGRALRRIRITRQIRRAGTLGYMSRFELVQYHQLTSGHANLFNKEVSADSGKAENDRGFRSALGTLPKLARPPRKAAGRACAASRPRRSDRGFPKEIVCLLIFIKNPPKITSPSNAWCGVLSLRPKDRFR